MGNGQKINQEITILIVYQDFPVYLRKRVFLKLCKKSFLLFTLMDSK